MQQHFVSESSLPLSLATNTTRPSSQGALRHPPSIPDSQDELFNLRDHKPKNKLRLENPADYFRRIARVQGTVVGARNLANTDTWGKSDPYCVVKGIRSNNHLVDIFVTRALPNTLNPSWEEDFIFECPESWGLVELVGLKFLVYDSDERYVSFIGSDDFLGGADLDLFEQRSGVSVQYERDLDGGPRSKSGARLFKQRKPRITVKITVWLEYTFRPVEFQEQLLQNLRTFERVGHLDCNIVKAKNLRNMDLASRSDPQVIVRAIFLDGSCRELYRTAVIKESLDPVWNERFHISFEYEEQPMLLVFDVYDDDSDGGDSTINGDHLGSALASFLEFSQVSKKRLEIQGSSQLLETLLDADGRSSRPYSVGKQGKAKAAKSTGGKFSQLRQLFPRSKGRSMLTVECIVSLVTEEMPHAHFLRRPQEIREEVDIELVLPSWERSMFPIPSEIQEFLDGEMQRVRPGTICGRDHVVFVHGVVHGASAIACTDALGKSDPYCLVEGLSIHGRRRFIHRTRCISATLSPAWHESFFCAAGEGSDIHKLMFSVYDSDEGEMPLENEEDDFLGNATVDLAYVLNGQCLFEDIPLVGAKRVGAKSSFSNGFRRNASISVEVRCERRVQPYFQRFGSNAFEWSPRGRHTISRKPASLGYTDMSQNELKRPSEAPKEVLQLYMKNQLLDSAAKRRTGYNSWLKSPARDWRSIVNGSSTPAAPRGSPSSRPSTAASEAVPELDPDQEQQKPRELASVSQDLYDFSALKRAPCLPRPASLPELHTKFHRTGALARPFTPDTEWLSGLQFRGEFERIAGLLTRDMCQKPSVQALTQIRDAVVLDHFDFPPAENQGKRTSLLLPSL